MSATERLRELLDERGVEWHDTKIGKGFITVYEHDGITWIATEHSSGRLSVKGCVKPTQGHYDGMTPEQAIAATLGVGTCHDKGNIERFICSKCGCRLDLQDDDWEATMWLDEAAMVPNFCPNCGRRVEVDE